jgi:hypothetical protein
MGGTIPDCKDALHILVSGFAKIAAVSFNAFGCIPSGPGYLFGFIFSSNLRTVYIREIHYFTAINSNGGVN